MNLLNIIKKHRIKRLISQSENKSQTLYIEDSKNAKELYEFTKKLFPNDIIYIDISDPDTTPINPIQAYNTTEEIKEFAENIVSKEKEIIIEGQYIESGNVIRGAIKILKQNKPEICDIPHIIELVNLDMETILDTLGSQEQNIHLISNIQETWENKYYPTTLTRTRYYMNKINNPEIWNLLRNDNSLNLNDIKKLRHIIIVNTDITNHTETEIILNNIIRKSIIKTLQESNKKIIYLKNGTKQKIQHKKIKIVSNNYMDIMRKTRYETRKFAQEICDKQIVYISNEDDKIETNIENESEQTKKLIEKVINNIIEDDSSLKED